MQIYILLFIFIMTTIASYALFQGDIIQPGFVVPFVFLVSTLFAMYNISFWGIDLSIKTTGLLGGGVFVYFAVSLITYLFITSTTKIKRTEKHTIEEIRVSNFPYYSLIILEVVATLLFACKKIKIVGKSVTNLIAWTQMQNDYKYMIHFTQESEGVSGIVIQMFQAVTVVGSLFAYVVLNNLVATKKVDRKNLVPVIIYIVSTVIDGNRLPLLRLVVYCLVVYFVLWRRQKGWAKKIRLKTICKLIGIMVGVLALFVAIRALVGRSQTKTPFYYISEYAGGSIQLFDLFVKYPIAKSNIFGYRTLYNVNDLIGRITGNSSLNYLYAYEFRKSSGVDIGNVYTGFRAFYEDFGTLGMFICIILNAFLFSFLYAKIKIRGAKKKDMNYDMPLIIFARMAYGYFFMSISFYSDYLSSTFYKLIIFFVICIFFMKTNLRGTKLMLPKGKRISKKS